jgi:hypothetical protein
LAAKSPKVTIPALGKQLFVLGQFLPFLGIITQQAYFSWLSILSFFRPLQPVATSTSM